MKHAAFILSMFLCAAAQAELKWEATTLEVRPSFGAKEAVGHFKYENAGQAPVRITSVHASCGCTTTQLLKNTVAPGEKGEIGVIFRIGDRTGTQIRDVTVQSSDADHPPETTKLLLKTVIASPLVIEPVLVYWNNGDETTPKPVMVNAAPGSVKSIKVTVSDPMFRVRFEQVGDSRFKIMVQPVETAKAARAIIKVQAEGSPKIFSATAVVTAKPAATAMSR